jgi:hypothetical protein
VSEKEEKKVTIPIIPQDANFRRSDCKKLPRFFSEKTEKYLQYFEYFSLKNRGKFAARWRFKIRILRYNGYIHNSLEIF